MPNPVDLENLSELRSYLQQKERTELNSSLIAEIHDQNWRAIWDILFDNATCNTIAVVDKYLDLIEFPDIKRRVPLHALNHYGQLNTDSISEVAEDRLAAEIRSKIAILRLVRNFKQLSSGAVFDRSRENIVKLAQQFHADSRFKRLVVEQNPDKFETLIQSPAHQANLTTLALATYPSHYHHTKTSDSIAKIPLNASFDNLQTLICSFSEEQSPKLVDFIKSLPTLKRLAIAGNYLENDLEFRSLAAIYRHCLDHDIDLYLSTIEQSALWELMRISPKLEKIRQIGLWFEGKDSVTPKFENFTDLKKLCLTTIELPIEEIATRFNNANFSSQLESLDIDVCNASLELAKPYSFCLPKLRHLTLEVSDDDDWPHLTRSPTDEFGLFCELLRSITSKLDSPLQSLRINYDLSLKQFNAILENVDCSRLSHLGFMEQFDKYHYANDFPTLPKLEQLEIFPHHEIKPSGLELFKRKDLPRLSTIDYSWDFHEIQNWFFDEPLEQTTKSMQSN